MNNAIEIINFIASFYNYMHRRSRHTDKQTEGESLWKLIRRSVTINLPLSFSFQFSLAESTEGTEKEKFDKVRFVVGVSGPTGGNDVAASALNRINSDSAINHLGKFHF